MKDVHKGLRLSVFNALVGITYDSTAVPVQDENYTGAAKRYIVLSTQTGDQTEKNDSTWITRATILLDVIQKTDAVSKDGLDDIGNQINEIIMPTRATIGLVAPAGFQYTNIEADERSLNLNLNSVESVTRKLITYSLDIVQQ